MKFFVDYFFHHSAIVYFFLSTRFLLSANTRSDESSSAEEELLVKPEMFSMTEANLCAILIDQYFIAQTEFNLHLTPSTLLFGDYHWKIDVLDDETLNEFDCRRREFSSAKEVFDFCIQKANAGIFKF